MAAKQYTIYFWHGRSESLAAELMAIEGVSRTDDDTLQYIGTLDNFAAEYARHFIVRPQESTPEKDYDDLICVTQYSNFGQR